MRTVAADWNAAAGIFGACMDPAGAELVSPVGLSLSEPYR